MSDTPEPDPRPLPLSEYRWQAFFQRGSDPLFLLDRFRRIRFVNRAWEKLTGIPARQARGLLCTRHPSADTLARTLCPPPEVFDGKLGRVRRLFPGTRAGPPWWDIEFFPLRGDQGLLGVLGRVSVAVPPQAVGTRSLPEELGQQRDRVAQRYSLDRLGSELPAMRRLADQVRLASRTLAPVLLMGEAGTGKHWLARTIHHQGLACEQPFVALDCVHLPRTALARFLPGDGQPSSAADIGTLYLIEPGRLPQDLQGKLIEWLAAPHRAGPRVIASTRAATADGDLYCALGTLTLQVPPLRERLADLPVLVDGMLGRANALHERIVGGLTPEADELLRSYAWPGNLRELYTVLSSACGHATGERIDVANLPAYLRQTLRLERVGDTPPSRVLPLDQLLEQVERRLIRHALHISKGNKSRAAELLGVWRPRLIRRLEALGEK